MKTALITGASNGIGLAIAKRLAIQGYDLILVARSADKLNAISLEICSAYQVKCQTIPCDLTQPSAIANLANQLKYIPIDLLINNAGCGDFGIFSEIEWSKHQQTITLNMLALTEMITRFLPKMKQQNQGLIVNIASIAAFQPLPYMAVYAATKAYVLNFSQALSYELRHTNIKVLTICPAATNTDFIKTAQAESSASFVEHKMDSVEDLAHFAIRKIQQNRSGVAIYGRLNQLRAYFAQVAPAKLVMNIAEKLMKPTTKK